MLHVIRSDDDGAYREFASSMFTDLAADNESWNKFRGVLLGIDDSQLEDFAKNLTNVLLEKITELPSFGQTVLVTRL